MMTDIEIAASDGAEEAGKGWTPVFLALPRFGLLQTRIGVSRHFLWLGNYERRKSRSLNALIYRRRR
jgi:hypothetical protein